MDLLVIFLVKVQRAEYFVSLQKVRPFGDSSEISQTVLKILMNLKTAPAFLFFGFYYAWMDLMVPGNVISISRTCYCRQTDHVLFRKKNSFTLLDRKRNTCQDLYTVF